MSFIFCMFVLLITKNTIMRTSKPFWELNLNPITMKPNDDKIKSKHVREGDIQLADEEWAERQALNKANKNIRRRSKFW